jgi:PadR family transcriptional regulator PadR
MSLETLVREQVQFGRGAQSYILLILARGRSYGYEIRQRLQDEFDYERAAADPGALYRLLRELEAAGLIASEWGIAETGPARRYYQLTDAGRAELRRGAERMLRQVKRMQHFLEEYEGLAAEGALSGERQR